VRITACSALIGLARAMGAARPVVAGESQRGGRVGGHERVGHDLVEPSSAQRVGDAPAHLLVGLSRPIASRRVGSVSGRFS